MSGVIPGKLKFAEKTRAVNFERGRLQSTSVCCLQVSFVQCDGAGLQCGTLVSPHSQPSLSAPWHRPWPIPDDSKRHLSGRWSDNRLMTAPEGGDEGESERRDCVCSLSLFRFKTTLLTKLQFVAHVFCSNGRMTIEERGLIRSPGRLDVTRKKYFATCRLRWPIRPLVVLNPC